MDISDKTIEKGVQKKVEMSSSAFLTQTAFGLARITVYLATPALIASWFIKHSFSNAATFIKLGLLLIAFVISWIIIYVDYKTFMKKQSILKKD